MKNNIPEICRSCEGTCLRLPAWVKMCEKYYVLATKATTK